jgi:DNA-binding transcriptional LysR family regulator
MSFPFDLTDLRLFLNIIDSGSITAGAQASHLSLASASSRVLGMEKSLQTPLLLRVRRGVLPTEAGQVLARHARGLLDETTRMRQDLQAHAQGLKGHLALMGTSAAVREYLPDTLGRFLAAHPHVNLTLGEAMGDEVLEALGVGSADIGFVTARPSLKGIEHRPYLQNRFALALPRGHALARHARGPAVSLAVADTCDIVGLAEGTALQDSWEAQAALRGTRLNYRIRVPGFDAMARLVARGVGVGLMPEVLARRCAAGAPIDVVTLSDSHLNRQLFICTRSFASLPAYGQRLVQMLEQDGGAAAAALNAAAAAA